MLFPKITKRLFGDNSQSSRFVKYKKKFPKWDIYSDWSILRRALHDAQRNGYLYSGGISCSVSFVKGKKLIWKTKDSNTHLRHHCINTLLCALRQQMKLNCLSTFAFLFVCVEVSHGPIYVWKHSEIQNTNTISTLCKVSFQRVTFVTFAV